MNARALAAALAALALLLPATACAGQEEPEKTTLTVLAAASLTDAFKDAQKTYQKEHPDVRLRFSFAGSQELAAQVRQGSPADVIATADEKTMKGLDSYVKDPQPFVSNRLTIVVAKDNPKKIESLRDLARKDVRVVLAGSSVPAGRYARQALQDANVTVKPKSEPTDVRQVLTPVRLGEADAGIVYVTDVTDAGGPDVKGVPIPDDQNIIATYPAAAIKDSEHAKQSTAFANWLRGKQAQKILKDHGFGAPTDK